MCNNGDTIQQWTLTCQQLKLQQRNATMVRFDTTMLYLNLRFWNTLKFGSRTARSHINEEYQTVNNKLIEFIS